MDYKLRIPKLTGHVVSLLSVAVAIAQARATAFGTEEFHNPTYEGTLRHAEAALLDAAKGGQLKVCDNLGFLESAEEIIEKARLAGTYHEVHRYVTYPDWNALRKKYPDRTNTNGVFDGRGLDDELGERVIDHSASEFCCLYATLTQLNNWGASVGNSFSLDEKSLPWIDERGVMGEPDALSATHPTVEPATDSVQQAGEPALAEKPADAPIPKKRRGSKDFHDSFDNLLNLIEGRAKECRHEFDRWSLPGIAAHLYEFAMLNRKKFLAPIPTNTSFRTYIKGCCKFKQHEIKKGEHPIYKTLFPELYSQESSKRDGER